MFVILGFGFLCSYLLLVSLVGLKNIDRYTGYFVIKGFVMSVILQYILSHTGNFDWANEHWDGDYRDRGAYFDWGLDLIRAP